MANKKDKENMFWLQISLVLMILVGGFLILHIDSRVDRLESYHNKIEVKHELYIRGIMAQDVFAGDCIVPSAAIESIVLFERSRCEGRIYAVVTEDYESGQYVDALVSGGDDE